MPARFRRIIYQQAQVSSFETFYGKTERLCWCQNILNSSRHIHGIHQGIHQTVAGKCSRYPTL